MIHAWCGSDGMNLFLILGLIALEGEEVGEEHSMLTPGGEVLGVDTALTPLEEESAQIGERSPPSDLGW